MFASEPKPKAHPSTKIKIPVRTAHAEERLIEVEIGSPATVIVDIVAAERGCRVEELILIRDGEDQPLTAAILIEEGYPHKRRHHVHHVGEIAVTIYYQAGQHTHRFLRRTTIEDVLSWAIVTFHVDPTMASELELVRHGNKEELPGAEHIGHVAGVQCELALDLVRGDIANGFVG
jgi:hypothetical protein